MKTLSLIIPIYNEQNTLDKIVEKTLLIEKDEFMIKNNIALEIVLVDDFSSDNSFEIAKELAKKYQNISVYRQEKNVSKGEPLKISLLYNESFASKIEEMKEELAQKELDLYNTLKNKEEI